MKNILIPFSGGLDSTYLVWKNLKEGNKVTLVYFEIENNNTKVTLEKVHREYLINQFRNEFSYDKLNTSNLKYKISANGIHNEYGLIQVPIWMLGAYFASNQCYDEIQMGYVMNDDALSYLEEIKNLYEAYQPFSQKPLPKMTFPIIKEMKEEMINDLPHNYKLFVYSCENPRILDNNKKEIVYRFCGDCVPCKRYEKVRAFEHYTFLTNNSKMLRIYDKVNDKFYIEYEGKKISLHSTEEELINFARNNNPICKLKNKIEVDQVLLEKVITKGFESLTKKEKNEFFGDNSKNLEPKQLELSFPITTEEYLNGCDCEIKAAY